jgi:hypothetical protein
MKITLCPEVITLLQALVEDKRKYRNYEHACNEIIKRYFNGLPAYTVDEDTRDIPPSEEELKNEEWKSIEDFPLYEVSTLGRVRSLFGKMPKPRKFSIIKQGYRQLPLSKNGSQKFFLVHRLVAAAFLPNPEGKPDVNHKDGNKANNRLCNLEWVTSNENQTHSVTAGIRKLGSKHSRSKLTEKDVLDIRELASKGNCSFKEMAMRYGVSETSIRGIVHNKFWKSVNTDI